MRSAVVLMALAGTAAAGPLDKAPFAATPDELFAEAKADKSTDPVVYLLDEVSSSFDDQGRQTIRFHSIVLIRDAAEADGWNAVGGEWSPAYQDKVQLRARVITPDKHVSELDTSLGSEAPVTQFAERMHVHAPLPKVVAGSIVEDETTVTDREPVVTGAKALELTGPGRNPVRRSVITVSAPTKLGVKLIPRGFAKAPQPKHTTKDGRETWVYALGPFDGVTHEVFLPPDAVVAPYIGVATGASWAAVASGYAKLVDAQLAAGPITADVHTPADAVAYVQAHVKPSEIELALAPPLPRSPSDTLKRGYGDDHDLALFVVGLLRNAHVQADLALIDTGPGPDLDRDLPGLGLFDHAIVRARIDGKDLWIDPSDVRHPVGQLPARDQGRWALVLAPDTRDLVKTPQGTAADNTVVETRTYHMLEDGHPSVTWTRRETGAFANGYRHWLATTSAKDASAFLTKRVDDMFGGTLGKYGSDASNDLVVEVTNAKRGGSDDGKSIDVYINPVNALDALPTELTDDEAEEAAANRHGDFWWSMPYRMSIENRIVVPSGYTMPAISPTDTLALGTMTLVTERRVDGDALVVTYKLDTGKQRITAKDMVAIRAAVKAQYAQNQDHFVFPETSRELERTGKVHDAIVEARRMIALHPKEARHHRELSLLMIHVGLGEAARREARKAIELEPKNASMYSHLGWTLARDTFGVYEGFDVDRAGSIAAYRKALELDPKHWGALKELATMLGSGEHGGVTPSAKDRTEAIALLRRAKAISSTTEIDSAIAANLLFAQDPDAEKVTRALAPSKSRTTLLFAAIAISRGPAAALAEADQLTDSDERAEALEAAAGWLMYLRRYDDARAVWKGKVHDPVLGIVYDKLAAVDVAKLDRADPSVAARLLVVAMFGTLKDPPFDADLARELDKERDKEAALFDELKVVPAEVLGDVVMLSTTTVEGDAKTGWRVELDMFGKGKMVAYVELDHGRAIVAALPSEPKSVGRYLRRLASKDLARATTVFDWLARDNRVKLPQAIVDERAKSTSIGRDLAELTAASLMFEDDPKYAIGVFHACALLDKKVCHSLEAVALIAAKRYGDAISLSREAVDDKPGDVQLAVGYAYVLLGAGHEKAAIAFLDEALAKSPNAQPLVRARYAAAVALHDVDDMHRIGDQLAGLSDVTSEDLNELTWDRLFYDADLDPARELAKRLEATGTKKKPLDPAFANTIAAVAAESDDVPRAFRFLAQSVKRRTPDDADWYVLGRIAQACGLRDDATALYKRVKDTSPTHYEPHAYDFAQRDLKRL